MHMYISITSIKNFSTNCTCTCLLLKDTIIFETCEITLILKQFSALSVDISYMYTYMYMYNVYMYILITHSCGYYYIHCQSEY